jgi:pyochelin synthetase
MNRSKSNHKGIPNVSLPELFFKQSKARPLHRAVVSNRRILNYLELYCESNRWARLLREQCVRPNTLVAVVMEKGWEQVLACVSIVQSGAAYLPIDPELPAERLAYMLENGEVEIVLTQSWLDNRLVWPRSVKRLCVDREQLTGISDEPIESAQSPDDLAYVIYTSGSTGQPKGAMITQSGVVNSVLCTNERFSIGPNDRVLALTALHHDMSVYDIFGTLAAGGTIVMPDAASRKDPAHWSELMLKHNVTIWNSVPAMMEMMLEYADGSTKIIPESLRLAFLGGDWISVTLPRRLKALAKRAQVVSVGGPTETTLWNIWYPVDEVDPQWKSIPYGKPIANAKYYVMNEALEECPTFTAGELCCSGVGLAKGYWKDPERTAAKFINHPRTGERIYRTGDIGRYLPDGNIEFLGREDQQVKINGQRIELGEIEATLQQHAEVRAAVVVAVGEELDRKRLIAYVVPASCQAVSETHLREYLSLKLPDYMIPSLFLLLDRLPLTPNGKVDRRALPQVNENRPELVTPYVEPATKMEQELAEIWRELLRVDRVGVADNLFDLGAQSIQVVQAHSKLKQMVDAELGIVTLFQYPTIRSLARYLTSADNQSLSTGKIRAQADKQRAAQARLRLARVKTADV